MQNRVFVRRFLAGLSAFLLVLPLSTDIKAQTAAMSPESARQFNSRLTAEANSGLPLTTQSRDMLVSRHAALVQSFRDSPATARSLALDAPTRASLLKQNPAYAALIEQDMTATGQLIVTIQDSFKTHTSRKTYSLHTATRDTSVSFAKIPVNLTAMEGHRVTVSGLGFPEVVAVESIRNATPAEAAAASTPVASTSRSAVARTASTNATPTFLGPGITTAAPATVSVTGPQNTAVIIVNFSSTPTDPSGNPGSSAPLTLQAPFGTQTYWNQMINTGPSSGAVPNLSAYIAETSYSKTTLSADVYGPFTVPDAHNCESSGEIEAEAQRALAAAGVDLSHYNRFIVPFPVTACGADGLGGGIEAATTTVPQEFTSLGMPFNQSETSPDESSFQFKFLVVAHEFGHNLGLGHSNTIDFGAITLGPIDFVATNPGVVIPGDPSHLAADAATPAASSTPLTAVNTEYGDPYPIMAGSGFTPYNAEHRYGSLNWIGTDSELDVSASGTFSVAPTENTTGLRVLHVLRDVTSNSWVWVEFHQPNSTYTTFGLTREPSDNTLVSGAELLYSTGSLDKAHTYLLDTTPTAVSNNFDDATLKNGSSWQDPYSLMTITAGSQTSSALGVTVSYDTACATPTLSSSLVTEAAGTGAVTVTAAAGCSWTVSSNASWISFTGSTSGTGNGSAPISYTANTTTNPRSTYLTTARQSQKLVQLAPASKISVVGVSPAGTTVAPGVSKTFTFQVNNLSAGTGSFYITFDSLYIATALKACYLQFDPVSDTPGEYSVSDYQSGGAVGYIGEPGTPTLSSCTINTGTSSLTTSNGVSTLNLSVSFPAGFTGNHQINGGNQVFPTASLGYVQVGTPQITYTTSTMLTATPQTITTAQSTVLQATVTSTPAGNVAGSVSFAAGATQLGTCSLSGGTCSITVAGSALQLGANSITATYAGLNSYPGSISAATTVTVTSAVSSQTITFNPLASKTYGAPAFTLTATASSGLPVTYTVTGPATLSGSTLTITGAGTVTVTASQAGNASYSAATPVQQSFTVAKAILTVTADSFSRAYGAANPTLTYKIAGYQNSETSIVVSGSATLTTTATSTSPVGSYPITFATQSLTATNYSFTYVAGALQVTIASQTITFGPLPNVTYGVSPITLTGTASSGLPIAYTVSGPATVSGSTITVNGTGSITVTATQAGNGNYSAASSVSQTFTSNPPAAGSVTLATVSTLQRLADNSYRATVTIKNSGTGTAPSVVLSVATLGSANGTPGGGGSLPQNLGSIASGSSLVVTYNFPASAGTPGSGSSAKFTGTYTGGTFGGTSRVTLP